MSNQTALTPKVARARVRPDRPLTPDKLEASHLLIEVNKIQAWWHWLLIDTAFALALVYTALTGNVMGLHIAICAYVGVFILDSLRFSKPAKRMLLLGQTNANGQTEENAKAVTDVAVNAMLMLVPIVFGIAAVILLLVPPLLGATLALIWAVTQIRSGFHQATGFHRALDVDRDAKAESWYPGFLAAEAQKNAAVDEALIDE